jgi:hypothetical protein
VDTDRLESTPWCTPKATICQKQFVAKFINQSLPMGTVFKKINPSQSTMCGSCQLHLELATHLYVPLSCIQSCDGRYLPQAASTLKTFLQDNHTFPRLANTLLDTIYCDLHNACYYPECKRCHGANDPKLQKLHQTQAFVGWSQLFQGRLLVQDRSRLQEEFLEENNTNLELDRGYNMGAIWARKLITFLWWIIHA